MQVIQSAVTSLKSMVYKIFDKKSTGSGIKNKVKQNQQLANKLQKNFEK